MPLVVCATKPVMVRTLLRFPLVDGSSLPASVNVSGDTVSALTEEEGDCMVYFLFSVGESSGHNTIDLVSLVKFHITGISEG